MSMTFLAVLCRLLCLGLLCNTAPTAWTQSIRQMPESAEGGAIYHVGAKRGTDITDAVQQAIDQVRANGGGTVLLPGGTYVLSDTLHFAGSADRFPKGGATGIVLRGGPTTLYYRGPEDRTLVDMPAPNNCVVEDITIDADNTAGIVGLRYRGGYDRGVNGGKGNTFRNIELRRMDVGLWIGDPFGPDLVSSTFDKLKITYVDVGIVAEGANVATMGFYNTMMGAFSEAGVRVVGHTARRVRTGPEDVLPSEQEEASPPRLTNVVTGEEIFRDEIPEYALEHRTFTREVDGQTETFAGGGAPDVTFYNFLGHSKDPSTWMFDSNWGTVRVYTARIEGAAGIFRYTSTAPASRFTCLLMDVNATSPGGLAGNAIEFHGGGPFYLFGGTFEGNVALGNNTTVYETGTRFKRIQHVAGSGFQFPGLVPQELDLARYDRVQRTEKTQVFPGRRGTYDKVTITPLEDAGFTQLPGTSRATIFGMTPRRVE